MTEHSCVRNPDTGACYVCRVPMRNPVGVRTALEAALEATQHPQAPAAPLHRCTCGAALKPSESQCVDCWIKEQTKQPVTPVPAPKPIKHNRPLPQGAITLESILDAMTEDESKWN